ncbi:FtsB family cell division protein [Microbacterium sp. CJ88]|uniref:FtsB family cell division protein n=1 Tax=Microbacterium sp. CJ88 TaxID=3445672 RepID=UPI003F65D68C
MAKTTAPPSRSRRPTRRTDASTRRVDVQGWLGGVRLSGFMVIMLGLVVLAAFVLVPTVGTFVAQRQQIAALQQAVQVGKDEVATLQAQRDRWKDAAYITTQARERLYYTLPGEVIYLVVDDLPAAQRPQEQTDVSAGVEQTRSDWMTQLVRSVTESGLARTATPQVGVPDPAPTASTPAG